jgi:hypothetical protein
MNCLEHKFTKKADNQYAFHTSYVYDLSEFSEDLAGQSKLVNDGGSEILISMNN